MNFLDKNVDFDGKNHKNIVSQFLAILSPNIQVFETFLSLKVVNHQKQAGYGAARTLLLIFQKSKQKEAGDGAARQL